MTTSNARNSDHTPLELLEEAQEIIGSLVKRYQGFLGDNKEIQQIISLVDAATFKLKAEKSENEDVSINEDEDEEAIDDAPMTAGDLAKGIFNYLTKD